MVIYKMGIIDVIRENKNIRKLFGKAELEIIERQLLGINLTQSEKNRLSRDIRKKFEAIKELANYSEEFNLKKGLEINKIVEDTKEIILEDELYSRFRKIILFGSSVANQRTFRSDIDIAVEFDNIEEKEALKFRLRIMRYINKKVDIQVYNVLPDKIKKEIDEKGRVIWTKEQKKR